MGRAWAAMKEGWMIRMSIVLAKKKGGASGAHCSDLAPPFETWAKVVSESMNPASLPCCIHPYIYTCNKKSSLSRSLGGTQTRVASSLLYSTLV